MEYSENVTFHPWIGKYYNKQQPKIFILGESMYTEENQQVDDPTEWQWRITKSSSGEWNNSFFTKIYKLFCESEFEYSLDNLTVKGFWDSVVFYEYIQEYLTGSRVPKKREQWEMSKKAFIEVLEKSKPDIIFSFGKEMYRELPDLGSYNDKIIIQHNHKKISSEVWTYNLSNNHKCLLVELLHPSAPGFTYMPWRKIISKTLIKYASN